MSVTDVRLKHGFVISQIVLELCKEKGTSIAVDDSVTRSGYQFSVYNEGKFNFSFGVFIKHSQKRRSPWNYTFTKDHQTDIELMYQQYGEVFVVLVNRDDGVACVSYDLLKQILDDNHEEVEWVSVHSQLRSQYSLRGKDGKLDKKISRSDFPRSIAIYAKLFDENIESDNTTLAERNIFYRLFGRK